MKTYRIIPLALAVMLVLGVCHTVSRGTTAGTDAAPTVSEPQTIPSTQPPEGSPESALTFLEGGTPVEGQENLLYLPETLLESFDQQDNYQLYSLEDAILICNSRETQSEGAAVTMTTVSMTDGSILGTLTWSEQETVTIQPQGSYVAVLKEGEEELWLYDQTLTQIDHHRLPSDCSDWALGPNLTTLYAVHWDGGVSVTALLTGEETWLIENAAQTVISGRDDRWLCVSYIDLDTQRNQIVFIDMHTREVTPMTFPDGSFLTSFSQGEALLQDNEDDTVYYLRTEQELSRVSVPQSGLTQIRNTGHLIRQAGDYVWLYDHDGTFLSGVQIPEGETVRIYDGPVWWEDQQGYFLTTQDRWSQSKLYYWDIRQSVDGEDLTVQAYEPEIPGGTAVSQSLYDRAAELSEKYGLDIRIADQCQLSYQDYTASMVKNENKIQKALDTLENALTSYPEGYFQQLLYGSLNTIRIELVEDLSSRNIADDAPYTAFAAFAQESENYYLVVVDVDETQLKTYFHEFTHITDRRLAWDAGLRQEALFSEERWLELQPEGFDYSYSYDWLPEGINGYIYGSAPWFVDDYSCTFPTEDRARLIEYSMSDWHWALQSPHLQEKLEYYSRCIRDCFDTTGWPEITVWESALTPK